MLDIPNREEHTVKPFIIDTLDPDAVARYEEARTEARNASNAVGTAQRRAIATTGAERDEALAQMHAALDSFTAALSHLDTVRGNLN